MTISIPAFPRCLGALLTVAMLTAFSPLRAEPVLRDGDLLAVCGDSITEQRLYSLYIQQYLLLCQPAENLMSMQFGWGGERAGGFASRVENDVLGFKPTVATTCYGMNDGNYAPVTEGVVASYRKAMTDVVKKLKDGGVRTIVVGSPGVVDTTTFKRPGADADTYNHTLSVLRDTAREVASAEGVRFADVHAAMLDAMTKAKAARGASYTLANDGVHPTANGQLAMAYAFLNALGVDGDIGTLTADYSSGKTTGSSGHQITGFEHGVLSIKSTRYPYCFAGKEDGNEPRGMVPFVPFNAELNRYRLVVKNAPARTRIIWGESAKEFTADQLSAGINLAAEFLDNPFSIPFAEATKTMQAQQVFETVGIKNMLNPLGRWNRDLPEGASHYEAIRSLIVAKSEAQRIASRAAVKPVSHQIKLVAVQ